MDWVERVLGIRQYERHGERAPHKPLLLLHALGRFQRDGAGPIPFSAAETPLRRLLHEFGPPRATSPGYPFHHLANDDLIWVVETPAGPGSPGSGLTALREPGVQGRLHPDLAVALAERPGLLTQIARALLDANFEPSLHGDICQEAGLDLDGAALPSPVLPARDPAFRLAVLEAYEFSCAFCDYDGLLDGVAVRLDAAHLRWRAYGGPDDLVNGLCLCALHHRLLDRGVMGLTRDRTVTVSRKFMGRGQAARSLVQALSGRPVRAPQPGLPGVEPEHIDWHTAQVFRTPARTAA
ncbi:phosphorothioated DNA-binding restriction endonuclease [Actinomadura xylanilytica]|uniref:phosphorothioated DNA-binding restriction endonuclease n=1 Tax=Actinomadura xylanilytica TaxID=887459 RepID=UPI00255B212F|nr:HNH endonuclease [Actinomadura xylanilytica]MDL4774516.1 restriction endonuclease [Actinomadura xylanilytica]